MIMNRTPGRMTGKAVRALRGAGFAVVLGASDRRVDALRGSSDPRPFVATFGFDRTMITYSGDAHRIAAIMERAGVHVIGARPGYRTGPVQNGMLMYIVARGSAVAS